MLQPIIIMSVGAQNKTRPFEPSLPTCLLRKFTPNFTKYNKVKQNIFFNKPVQVKSPTCKSYCHKYHELLKDKNDERLGENDEVMKAWKHSGWSWLIQVSSYQSSWSIKTNLLDGKLACRHVEIVNEESCGSTV